MAEWTADPVCELFVVCCSQLMGIFSFVLLGRWVDGCDWRTDFCWSCTSLWFLVVVLCYRPLCSLFLSLLFSVSRLLPSFPHLPRPSLNCLFCEPQWRRAAARTRYVLLVWVFMSVMMLLCPSWWGKLIFFNCREKNPVNHDTDMRLKTIFSKHVRLLTLGVIWSVHWLILDRFRLQRGNWGNIFGAMRQTFSQKWHLQLLLDWCTARSPASGLQTLLYCSNTFSVHLNN